MSPTSPVSPVSPQTSLRRRGRSNAEAGGSTPKQPVSPVHHHGRSQSSTSDSFGDFMESSQPGDVGGSPIREEGGSIDEDWQDADLVDDFSPVTTEERRPSPAPFARLKGERPPNASSSSGDFNALDWDAWETPRGPTPLPEGKATKTATEGAGSSHIDDAFFSAFEQATIAPSQQRPSPPIIDLRDMERKLEEEKKRTQQQGLDPSELDFFETFDKAPRQVMSRSRERSERNVSLKGSQLESMTDAQASPMDIINSDQKRHARPDYFGNTPDLLADSPVESSSGGAPLKSTASPGRSDSWTETAGLWAGTLRKTLGSLRGQAAEFAQHLPSSKDFIVPEDYQDDVDPHQEEEVSFDRQQNGHHGEEAEKGNSAPRRIAKAADYSQGTPFGTSSGVSNPAGSPPLQYLRKSSTSSALPSHGTIKGAPGFDPNPVHNWNTGSWSLSSKEESQRNKKPIPVQLKGRREETQDVVEETIAAHLTAHLPKRMQLGKSWKLLYSSDQHGISLSTLYWKVQSGLDLGKGSNRKGGGGGAASAEGWLRGASQATQEAVTGVRRVGGGLTLTDAGLILAVKDSEDRVFGVYVNERLQAQSHYYGNGECFLWKSNPDGTVKTFPWTGRNDYMVLTEAHYLSFGGGDGKYGLWIDGQLEKGISARSPAFDNEVLCSTDPAQEEGQFECITLEVWACGID